MPCLLTLFALAAPRTVLVILWLFSDFLGAYTTTFWPVLGFILMPMTTLAYAAAIQWNGSVTGFYFAIGLLAALIDLGVVGGGARTRRDRED